QPQNNSGSGGFGGHFADQLAGLPAGARKYRALDDAVLVALDRAEHRGDQFGAKQVRLEAEVQKLRVRRVVVVLLELHSRVRELADLDLAAGLGGGRRD